MKAQIEARVLAQSLRRASKYTGTPKGLPILGQARISNTDLCCTVETTDLDNAYRETIAHVTPDEPQAPGAVLVNCRTLLATIAKHAKGAPIEIESNGGTLLHVRNGSNANAALPTMPLDDFPVDVDTPNSATVCSVDAAEFARVFRAVAPMVSTDVSRLELCGVNVELSREGGLTLTATNGHILATETINYARAVVGSRPCDALVAPRPLLSFFGGPKSKPTGEYELTFWPMRDDPQHVAMRFLQISQGSRVLRMRLFEGPYPEYRRVIPQGSADVTARLEVDAVALGEAVAAVLPATDPRTRQVLLETVAHVNGETGLQLTAESTDNGKAVATVPIVRNGDREDIRCGVNGAYLARIAKAAGGASLELEYRSAVAGQVWRAGDLLAMLMPLRLPDVDEAGSHTVHVGA